jgi:hypothetical protein
MKDFQERVAKWCVECFGSGIADDKYERSARFLEEALELVQAGNFSRQDAHALVDYVFSRPIGEPAQEVGGVMVTLAAWCRAWNIDLRRAAYAEYLRINKPAIIEKIRAKNASKPKFGPLPGTGPLGETDMLDSWCSVCGERQFRSPGGAVCQNGHGGAPGTAYIETLAAKPAEAIHKPTTPALAALASFRRARA